MNGAGHGPVTPGTRRIGMRWRASSCQAAKAFAIISARRRSRVRARVASSWAPGPSASSTSKSVTKAKARKRSSTKRLDAEVVLEEAAGPRGVDARRPRAGPRGPRRRPLPGAVDVRGRHLDGELGGLAHRELGVQVARELGVGDRAGRRLEAEHAERPRERHVAQHDRARADLREHRVHEAARRRRRRSRRSASRREPRPTTRASERVPHGDVELGPRVARDGLKRVAHVEADRARPAS